MTDSEFASGSLSPPFPKPIDGFPGIATVDINREAYLTAQPQREEHEEEERGPELWQRHAEDGLGVHDEGQARPRINYLPYGHPLLVRQETHDGENGEARKHGREKVGHCHDECVAAATWRQAGAWVLGRDGVVWGQQHAAFAGPSLRLKGFKQSDSLLRGESASDGGHSPSS